MDEIIRRIPSHCSWRQLSREISSCLPSSTCFAFLVLLSHLSLPHGVLYSVDARVVTLQSVGYVPSNWSSFNYSCQICPPGTFANQSVGSNCTAYDTEGVCSQLSGTCPFVPPDLRRAFGLRGNTLCNACPYNMISEGRVDACSYCDYGYQPCKNNSCCVECDAGYVSNNDTSRVCVQCTQGSYANITTSECEYCQPGYSSKNSINCTECDRGHPYNVQRHNCDAPCAAGEFCPPGAEGYCLGCEPCWPGSYSPTEASSTCFPCPPGTSQSSAGKSSCRPCDAGYIQPFSNQTSCRQCRTGYFCPNGTSEIICPSHKHCPAGSTSPIGCNSLYKYDSSKENCVPSIALIAIIIGASVAGVLLISILIYQRYKSFSRRRDEENADLLRKQQNKEPVYSGL